MQLCLSLLRSEVCLVVNNGVSFVSNGIDHEFLFVELEMHETAFIRITSQQVALDEVLLVYLGQLYLALFYVLYLPVSYLPLHSSRTQIVSVLHAFKNSQMGHLMHS